jgi:exosome complex component RRP45
MHYEYSQKCSLSLHIVDRQIKIKIQSLHNLLRCTRSKSATTHFWRHFCLHLQSSKKTLTTMMATSYVGIRDDAGAKSLSTNERNFLRSCALAEQSSKVLRGDGRGPGDLRKIQTTLNRWDNGAECTAQWGSTRVSATLTGSLQPPNPDRPSEGVLSISVELSPMASTSFGIAAPITTAPGGGGSGGADAGLPAMNDSHQKLLSNRIVRCLERIILTGGALDTEALCVSAGAWVWNLTLQVRLLDHGGNALDASVLAAMAALRHYRKPQATDGQALHADVREPTPLPLHHTPLTCSFALIHADDMALSTNSTSTVAALMDPTDREELVQTGAISMGMNVHAEVCLLDFGGGCELKAPQLRQCWKLAEAAIVQLCHMLEALLTAADEKANLGRLHRLQQQQNGTLPPLPMDATPQVPFWHEDDDGGVQVMDTESLSMTAKNTKEEEEYRLNALDFAQGHVAAKVKDVAEPRKKEESSSLLAAMLKSVQVQDNIVPAAKTSIVKKAASKIEEASASMQSNDAKEEFAQFAKKAKKEVALDSDDDEEETTMMLQTEFASVEKPNNTAPIKMVENEDDVDDLAMAIKSKKSKSKKTKK